MPFATQHESAATRFDRNGAGVRESLHEIAAIANAGVTISVWLYSFIRNDESAELALGLLSELRAQASQKQFLFDDVGEW